jgi:hypothetical protein
MTEKAARQSFVQELLKKKMQLRLENVKQGGNFLIKENISETDEIEE